MIENVYTSQPPANVTVLGVVSAEHSYYSDTPHSEIIEVAIGNLLTKLSNIKTDGNSTLSIYAANYSIEPSVKKVFATGTVARVPK